MQWVSGSTIVRQVRVSPSIVTASQASPSAVARSIINCPMWPPSGPTTSGCSPSVWTARAKLNALPPASPRVPDTRKVLPSSKPGTIAVLSSEGLGTMVRIIDNLAFNHRQANVQRFVHEHQIGQVTRFQRADLVAQHDRLGRNRRRHR